MTAAPRLADTGAVDHNRSGGRVINRFGTDALSDDDLVTMLREPADAAVRNVGLERLVERGQRVVPMLVSLLSDRDADVVLQATRALDRIRDHRAAEGLVRVLDHPNPNVVQSAIVALGHVGSRAVVGRLLRFLHGDSGWSALP